MNKTKKMWIARSKMKIWLVAWNMAFICPGNNILNWRTHIFQRGWNHQPEIHLHLIVGHVSLVYFLSCLEFQSSLVNYSYSWVI